ncbi:MAG: NUDIX hydrolase, partial [Clostridia bacterium]
MSERDSMVAGGLSASDEEWVDVVDDEGQVVGRASREDAHRRGLRHPTVHVWVLRPLGGRVRVVFQWRTPDRLDFPNLLDVTAGGHVRAGEGTLPAMRRELHEELGLSRVRIRAMGGVPIDAVTHGIEVREWAYEYVHVTRRPLARFQVAREEVHGLLEAPLEALRSLHRGRADAVMMSGVKVNSEGWVPCRRSVTRADFVPAPDEHWAALWDRL